MPSFVGTSRVLHLANFKYLRVFALERFEHDDISVSCCLSVINLSKVLGSLVYLRYLSLHGSWLWTFPSIQKLELLKTLNLNAQDRVYFPPWLSINILSKLGHLRHLYLPRWGMDGFGKNRKLRLNGLSKLEIIENFDSEYCKVEDLAKLFRLEKLKLQVVGDQWCDMEEMIKHLSSYSHPLYLTLTIVIPEHESENGAHTWRQFFGNYNLRLEELKIEGMLPELSQIFGGQQQQLDVSSIRITKLHLYGSGLKEDPMPVLEKIPTLHELGLFNDAYIGKEMVCSAMGFPELTRLQLDSLPNLVEWRVEEGSMPILQYVDIHGCDKLEELPERWRDEDEDEEDEDEDEDEDEEDI